MVVTSRFAAEETRHSDRREWRFEGATVTELRFDASGLQLHIWTMESDLLIRLATTIQLSRPEGSATLEPERTSTLASVLSLLGCRLTSAVVSKTGSLTLQFEPSHAIGIVPHPQYEAWEAHGSGVAERFAYLCGPGGGSPWG
ncbi:MAG TPA: DUF6188 family protein [Thermoanaerobaculia bacterium]|nr:DUF6188 family protein [Thermoanaerobaculia bacterium]